MSKSGCTPIRWPSARRSITARPHLLYLVTDINQPGYQQALDQGLIALFRALEGQGDINSDSPRRYLGYRCRSI